MATLQKRVLANGASALYGTAVVTLSQVLMVPLFLSHWGARLYGEWLAISALPAYFSMSDFGLGPVAGNRVAMLAASGNLEGARITVSTTWCVQVLIALAAIGGVTFGVYYLPIEKLGAEAVSIGDLRALLVMLTAYVLANMLSGVFIAVYRGASKNARGVSLVNSVRCTEVLLGIGTLLFDGGVITFAALMLLTRVFGLVLLWADTRRQAPQIDIGWNGFSKHELRLLLKPAMGHVGLSLGGGLQLQGFLLLVSRLFGPFAVVQFSLLRTATRFCVQLVLIINNAVYPEFSGLLATKSFERARELYRLAVQSSAWLSGLYGGALMIMAPWIIPLWSAGKVQNDFGVLSLLCAGVIMNSIWSTSSLVLSSSNNHARLGVVYVVVTVIGLCAAYLFGLNFGLWGVAGALAVTDAAMLAYTSICSCGLMQDRPAAVFKDVIQLGAVRRRIHLLRNPGSIA